MNGMNMEKGHDMGDRKRLIIVGGGAGGGAAAARARRVSEDTEIIVFERGEHISVASCGLPYHIGGVIADRDRLLVQTPESMHKRFRVDVQTRTQVLRIDRERREVIVRNLDDGQERVERYDTLILASGADPVRPPIPGGQLDRVFTLRTLEDMDAIKKAIDTEQLDRAVVIGGGYIGLEMAEALRERGVAATMVELLDQVMNTVDVEMAAPIHQELVDNGVDLKLNTSVTSIVQQGDEIEVHLSTGEAVQCGMVVMAVGVGPELGLAKEAGLIEADARGIRVDDHLRTVDPNIYAVGDMIEMEHFVGGIPAVIPLAGPASRQGRIAADNALGRDSVYGKTQGTGICKVFGLAAGMTGLNEKMLQRAKMKYEKIYVHPASHASYYPGASQMSLKLLFDPESGRVLGAQVVGAEGVDKRIDVIATAMRAGMTVSDLKDLELCYAPPYGSVRDPVNYAGFVATNVMNGDMPVCHVEDVLSLREDQMLLDVRTVEEVEAGTIPGAKNIPLDELRERLGELPRSKEMLTFCQVGLRGYLATRVLNQNGFICRNLTGGYKTYKATTSTLPKPVAAPAETTDDSTSEGSKHERAAESVRPVRHIDACGLQCPGPIMRLKSELENLEPGQAVSITTGDPAFQADVAAWCHSTGNSLVEVSRDNGNIRAIVQKEHPRPKPTSTTAHELGKDKTMVVFSGDFDKAMASFIIANGAAAMGGQVTMFFTFWGLNILRRDVSVPVAKNFIERMFGWMMPRGADRLTLSKMNMGGLGTRMIKGIMRKKNMPSLPELIESAQKAGVELIACSMSMDLMGIKRDELIDGVEEGGVAMYLDRADQAGVNLFI